MRPIARLAAVLALSALAGCDFCEPGDLRCSGHVVESCNAQRNWEEDHDCGADTCGVGRDVCKPFIDLGIGEVWCCMRPVAP